MRVEAIGKYRILEKLGEGGVGEVFRAVDPVLERAVAIKRLRPELASREQIVERFCSEAQTLARLNHPNIATLYSFERDGDALLMVMEYVEGHTLANLLRSGGGLQLAHALPLFFQALDGIGYAHRLGIIHRDIKGSNLMVNDSGVLKVMDFGIARVIGSERMTLMGQLVGTPEFMSPEQIRGDETDARSDIYSLGILLYALLSGRVPFAARSGFDLMRAQIDLPPPSLSQHIPDLPEELEPALLRSLEKDPEKRFASTGEFQAALLPLLRAQRPETGEVPEIATRGLALRDLLAENARNDLDAAQSPPPLTATRVISAGSGEHEGASGAGTASERGAATWIDDAYPTEIESLTEVADAPSLDAAAAPPTLTMAGATDAGNSTFTPAGPSRRRWLPATLAAGALLSGLALLNTLWTDPEAPGASDGTQTPRARVTVEAPPTTPDPAVPSTPSATSSIAPTEVEHAMPTPQLERPVGSDFQELLSAEPTSIYTLLSGPPVAPKPALEAAAAPARKTTAAVRESRADTSSRAKPAAKVADPKPRPKAKAAKKKKKASRPRSAASPQATPPNAKAAVQRANEPAEPQQTEESQGWTIRRR